MLQSEWTLEVQLICKNLEFQTFQKYSKRIGYDWLLCVCLLHFFLFHFPWLLANGPRRESTSNEFRSIPSSKAPGKYEMKETMATAVKAQRSHNIPMSETSIIFHTSEILCALSETLQVNFPVNSSVEVRFQLIK